MHKDIRSQWKQIDAHLNDKDTTSRELLARKLSQYTAFVEKIAPGHPKGTAGSVLDWSERRTPHDGRHGGLWIAGLCSAWVSDKDDAERKLVIGEHSLQELHGAHPNDLLIVLTHHPPSWLQGDSARLLENRLAEKRPYLHLCGHVHEQTPERHQRLGDRKLAFRLVAGATHGDPGGEHAYSWGAIRWRTDHWELGWAPRIYVEGRGVRPDKNRYDLDEETGFLWEQVDLPWPPPGE
jgi:hypothetical protein